MIPKDGNNFTEYGKRLNNIIEYDIKGRVIEANGLIVKAKLIDACIGDVCQIKLRNNKEVKIGEVLALKDDSVYIIPFDGIEDISKNDEIINTKKRFSIKVSPDIIGRVMNGIGEIVDDKDKIFDSNYEILKINKEIINPLLRVNINKVFETGVKAIDAVLTCGEGQRIGIFSAAGIGKSSLIGMIARNSSANVNIIALIGERGREVNEFIKYHLTEKGLAKSVVVISTSDTPPLMRVKAAFIASSIAEYFCSKGNKVLLLMDSITRLARAQREVGLAIGEPPVRYGFTPSVFSLLPKITEKPGNYQTGSITAFYTILMEGDDPNEPISDEMRSLLDGHIILSKELAFQNHYPAIDISQSISRVMNNIVSNQHKEAANKLRKIISIYNNAKDAILIGAYKYGSNQEIDYAINIINHINEFLKQNPSEFYSFEQSTKQLFSLFKNAK